MYVKQLEMITVALSIYIYIYKKNIYIKKILKRTHVVVSILK